MWKLRESAHFAAGRLATFLDGIVIQLYNSLHYTSPSPPTAVGGLSTQARRAQRVRPWILSEINYGYLREHPCEVAVLPMGATEPHNLHLPYGTDIFEAETIAGRACEAAFNRGARVVMLPAIPYGTDTNQLGFPLAINLNPSTLTQVIRDIVDSLAAHGIVKLLILNSHGGNDFKTVLRELYGKTPVRLFFCDWYRMATDVEKQIFSDAGRSRRRSGNVTGPGLLSRPRRPRSANGPPRGRRRRRQTHAIRRRQSGLDLDHAARGTC